MREPGLDPRQLGSHNHDLAHGAPLPPAVPLPKSDLARWCFPSHRAGPEVWSGRQSHLPNIIWLVRRSVIIQTQTCLIPGSVPLPTAMCCQGGISNSSKTINNASNSFPCTGCLLSPLLTPGLSFSTLLCAPGAWPVQTASIGPPCLPASRWAGLRTSYKICGAQSKMKTQGRLFKYYEEFQDSDSRAPNFLKLSSAGHAFCFCLGPWQSQSLVS